MKINQWNLPVSDINSLIKTTPFVVCGGIATRAYSPERDTKDLDILIRESQAYLVEQELSATGCTFQKPLLFLLQDKMTTGSNWMMPDGVELDVLNGNQKWTNKAIENPNRNNPLNLPIIKLEYLVLMKISALRNIDTDDLSAMLGHADDKSLNEIRKTVQKFLPSALEDLESYITIGKYKFQNKSYTKKT